MTDDGLPDDHLPDYLLAALRMAAGVDPVPGRVSDAARDAYSLRLPGGVVAAPYEIGAAVGARSEGDPAMHRFGADGITLDVEVTVTDGRLDVAGQVSPAPGPGARVEVRTPGAGETRIPSESGHFAVAGLPSGWISVVCHRPGLAPVATRWLHVRD
ncbi:carboxypeptidase-like regulatory domain-containing protein [Microtetraspora sp. AC03309]|uniref:carboxypeptidase-like regulatory domain-containing protein n=1 Tax=Microtetraspora sp. AC03309 TaxID=2779376 RepID=UPI001E485AEA|nr:carboxypeptidase-like regulatory domain-containing protein [Microtetraspora sp. AC03309]